MSGHEVELIEFKNPVGTQTYASKIPWNDSREGLIAMLEENFSKFGLLHSVRVERSSEIASGIIF